MTVAAWVFVLVVGWLAIKAFNPAYNPPPEQLAESVDYSGGAEVDDGSDDGVEGERSGRWTTVRNRFVEKHPTCEACGSDENLNVHHVKPFHQHPDLELEESNLITLCREHHFYIGHDPDGVDGPEGPNWKLSNPSVRRDARSLYESLQQFAPN